jgi:hypothetical protein
MLEVALHDHDGLVALYLCSDYYEAVAVAFEWRTNPPARWPEEFSAD